MVIGVDPVWAEEIDRGSDIIYLVDMYLGPAAFLDVIDHNSGAGSTFSVTIDSSGTLTFTFTEGVDFARDGSDTQCAANMAATINATPTLNNNVVAASSGPFIGIFAKAAACTRIVTATGNVIAWAVLSQPCPQAISFVSGSRPMPWGLNGEMCPASIDDVHPFAYAIDELTRESSVGDSDITFVDDGELRDFFARCRPRGKVVRVFIGTEAMTGAQVRSCPIATMTIEDYHPAWGECTVRLADPLEVAATNQVSGKFCFMHPLAVIRRVLNLAHMPASFWDDSTLESTAAGYSDISHWVIQRHDYWGARHGQFDNHPLIESGDRNSGWDGTIEAPEVKQNGIKQPMEARAIIAEQCLIMDGSFLTRENGVASFVRYDGTIPKVRHLSNDDIQSFETLKTIDNLFNRFDINGMIQLALNGQQNTPLYSAADSLSEQANGAPGYPRDFSKPLTTEWMGMPGFLYFGSAAGGASPPTTTIRVLAPNGAFCGTRQSSDGASSNTMGTYPQMRNADRIGLGGRVSWLLLVNTAGGWYEIVSAVEGPGGIFDVSSPLYRFQIPTTAGLGNYFEPAYGTFAGSASIWGMLSYTITRAQKGTSQADFTYTATDPARHHVYDITMAVDMAERRLQRFANGCPKVRLVVPLIHADLQVGDAVTIDEPSYMNFNRSKGADSIGPTWEIVSKQVDALNRGVELVLAWMRDDGDGAAFNTTLVVTPLTVPGGVGTPVSSGSFMLDNEGVPVIDNEGFEIYAR